MGFFKSIGKKLKRVVSLKNLTRVVSGKFGELGKDIVRVATTADPRGTPEQQAQEYKTQNFDVPQEGIDLLNYKYATQKDKLLSRVAGTTIVKEIADAGTKVYLKSMWFKYKNWIIGLIAAIVLFIVVRMVWRKRPTSNARRR